MKRTLLALTVLILASLPSPAALAADLLADWTTASHLGYGVVDSSTTGFKDVAGSLAYLDLTHRTGGGVDVGLRTVGQGGRLPQRQFYRLGAGPLVSWTISQDWLVQGALTTFDETGVGPAGERLYASRGAAGMIGWERLFHIGARAEFAVGGFASRQQGQISEAGPTRSVVGSVNAGWGHGLEGALRVRL